ncbi:hypothetical protein H4S06_001398 [Coemansia sp. BCRC 34490]|nr:hypothetical protein H4S06_001398 [Coemansia sp. BCRC 34490]
MKLFTSVAIISALAAAGSALSVEAEVVPIPKTDYSILGTQCNTTYDRVLCDGTSKIISCSNNVWVFQSTCPEGTVCANAVCSLPSESLSAAQGAGAESTTFENQWSAVETAESTHDSFVSSLESAASSASDTVGDVTSIADVSSSDDKISDVATSTKEQDKSSKEHSSEEQDESSAEHGSDTLIYYTFTVGSDSEDTSSGAASLYLSVTGSLSLLVALYTLF